MRIVLRPQGLADLNFAFRRSFRCIIRSVYVTGRGCNGIGEYVETGVRECSSLYYLKITLLFEMQIFWVDSVVRRLVSSTTRRGELVAQWVLQLRRLCIFSKCVVITSKFAHYSYRILTHIYDSCFWQCKIKQHDWKPCRANLIDPTEEYTVTSFTIPLRKMNFSVVNRRHIKL